MSKIAIFISALTWLSLLCAAETEAGKIIGPLKRENVPATTTAAKGQRAKKLLAQVAEQQKQIEELQDQVYRLQTSDGAAIKMVLRDLQSQLDELQTQVEQLQSSLIE